MTITIAATDLLLAVMIFILAAILTIYNHRQAAALRGVERLVEDFVSMQYRDRMTKKRTQVAELDPFAWLSKQVSQSLDHFVEITDAARIERAVNAGVFNTTTGKKIIVSSRPPIELKQFDARQRASRGRVDAFASRPLLKGKYHVIERKPDQNNEFFAIEAGAVGERLGLDWGEPLRLWFYVEQ